MGIVFFGCSSDDYSNSPNLVSDLFPCLPNNGNPEYIYPCDLTLDTQNDVDIFSQGGFTEIDGNLTIEGQDINNLNGLFSLVKTTTIVVKNNSQLNSLNGLQNVQTLRVRVENNPLLENLQGIGQIIDSGTTSILSALVIKNNANLKSLSGIGQLPPNIDLLIEDNSELISLNGLQTTTSSSLGWWRIYSNPKLESLLGLENLEEIFHLSILGNTLLTDLKFTSLTNVIKQLDIGTNNSLVDLSSISQLQSAPFLHIVNNNSLQNLNGLQNLTTVTNLSISQNEILQDISQISNLEEVVTKIEIHSNPSLVNFCVIYDLYVSGVLLNAGDWDIQFNGYNPDIINGNCSP